MKTVEVVVPCYNYARFLAQAVDSAVSQSGVNVRVVIIDDCSGDDTPMVAAELVRKYSGVSYRRNSVNRGHVATFNSGIAALEGEYFLLLSADDYLLPGALALAVSLMDAHPEIGFVFGAALMRGDDGNVDRLIPLPRSAVQPGGAVLSGQRFVELSGGRNIVPTPTAVVRASLQRVVGGYRSELPHTGDMEMWLRLAGRAAVGYVDADMAVYRLHGTNMSIGYDGLADLQERRKALEIFFADGALRLDPSGGLKRRCLHRFAGEAFRQASMAMNRGELAAAARFRDYGLATSPTARRSLGWLKLLAKQTLQSLPTGR